MPDSLFGLTGNVVFADFRAAQLFAHRINEQLDLERYPERAISASKIYALGLIDEILHLLVARHRREKAPSLWRDSLARLEQDLGAEAVARLLRAFVEEFPSAAVYRGEVTPEAYLAGATAGVAHRELVLEEMLLLWLANRNPAFDEFRELFNDEVLRNETSYVPALETTEKILGDVPSTGVEGSTLLDLLYAPMRAAPQSLEGQLEFLRASWIDLLGPDLHRVLGSLDLMAEEHRVVFPPGPGPVEPPDYRVLAETGERYSADQEWMPQLVLLAKNAYVWLAQLGDKYGRKISTLDEIPDEELARLKAWGITGLWLIGVWERSRASERIKRMMGDEDAVASAYSLQDYRIADALGGEPAYENLRARADAFDIRLSTDMVPNHMGIDSRWLIEHPDWFLSVDEPPYPGYRFDGPDLSDDDRVGIFIEDKYWEKSDAAVVFKRLDRLTGDARYIYHGNDGTSMPWNDTAQLDYLNPEVREGVIQTILAVARRSPVIRFDAAMTLARQHYHRLWFPEPGAAGAVPSRAAFGMPKADFDAAMPREFWREVVERVALEAPDTLLLAEAFWLLEGYFVRTLGMHRVYNSAFMNMLRDERNAEYRQLIRSTLEFDPQILKRYVNFMSNPDERTAVDQFGTGDKYFGVMTMMATMPGLPMLGHGQIEGLAEKYGMEFHRPRWDEKPNEGLVWRHELQVFPLLNKRRIFSEVDNFLLYDFETADGGVDENVFAYSNEIDGERSLVVYHNHHGESRGRLRLSTAVARRSESSPPDLIRTGIADGLGLGGDDTWLIVRDGVTGLQYLRSCGRIRSDGFEFHLDPYRLHCFLEFRVVTTDEQHPWDQLASRLGDRGVPSVEQAVAQLVLAPVLDPFRELIDPVMLQKLARVGEAAGDRLRKTAVDVVPRFVDAVMEHLETEGSGADTERLILTDLEAALALRDSVLDRDSSGDDASTPEGPLLRTLGTPEGWAVLIAWISARHLATASEIMDAADRPQEIYEAWHLRSTVGDVLHELGKERDEAHRMAAIVDVLMPAGDRQAETEGPIEDVFDRLKGLFESAEGRRWLGVHRHDDVLWFNRESFEEMADGLATTVSVETINQSPGDAAAGVEEIVAAIDWIVAAADSSGYRVEEFFERLRKRVPGAKPVS